MQIIELIDLTDLSDNDHEAKQRIVTLCKDARTPLGPVAAVCLYPQYITIAKQLLADKIPVATVVNFPAGNLGIEQVKQDILDCLKLGADEIDVVLPYSRLKEQDYTYIENFLAQCRAMTQGYCLKVIIESGLLTQEEIKIITDIICDAGADFVKTSTGKIPGKGASLDAVESILSVFVERQVKGKSISGIKISGGINRRNVEEYLNLIGNKMGSAWITAKNVRIGASALLNELIRL